MNLQIFQSIDSVQEYLSKRFQRMIERGQFPVNSCFPSSLPGQCKVETTPLAVKEDPDSEKVCKEVSLDISKDAELHTPKSLTEPQATFTPSSVDKEREMARKKEQERRRREAVSTSVYRFVLRTKMAF